MESRWLSRCGATAIRFEAIKPSGDVQLEGAYGFGEAISMGAPVRLAATRSR